MFKSLIDINWKDKILSVRMDQASCRLETDVDTYIARPPLSGHISMQNNVSLSKSHSEKAILQSTTLLRVHQSSMLFEEIIPEILSMDNDSEENLL